MVSSGLKTCVVAIPPPNPASLGFEHSVAVLMSLLKVRTLLLGVSSFVPAYDIRLGFNTQIEVGTRSLDEIYQAALEEGTSQSGMAAMKRASRSPSTQHLRVVSLA